MSSEALMTHLLPHSPSSGTSRLETRLWGRLELFSEAYRYAIGQNSEFVLAIEKHFFRVILTLASK